MPLKIIFKRWILEALHSKTVTPSGPHGGQWSTWCLSHSMALSWVLWSQNAQLWNDLPICSNGFHAHLWDLEAEDSMGQSIPFLLKSTLKIIALGRYSKTDKGNVFLGLPVPAPWSLAVFDLAFAWCTHSLWPQENVLSLSILEALSLSVRKQKEIPSKCVPP